MTVAHYLATSAEVLQRAATRAATAATERAIGAIVTALSTGKPLLVCGNGGSASDAMHITGELVGRFLRERRALNCVCLSSNPAVLTAWANDYSFETVFSRQVEAYGAAGGVLLALSTSGNSPNVVAACRSARALGMTTIAMTGEGGGRLAEVSDILIDAPTRSTPLVQQVHICVYHYVCEQVEARLAGAG